VSLAVVPPPIATRAGIFAWCSFDWANSAFPTVILTFVFSAYFTSAVAASPEAGTAQWGWALAISGILIAVASPVLGAIADMSGRRKPWLAAASVVCIAATAALWLIRPDPAWALAAVALVMLANAAFEIGMVFYNAMLPDIAEPRRIGRISGWAWGLGYAGGLVCLVICLFAFVQADPALFGLDKSEAEHVRAVAPFVALWFALFAWPLFRWTPDRPRTGTPPGAAVRRGLATLLHTLRGLPARPALLRFLVARLFYVDGLNTIFAFGGIYAAGTFGMSVAEIIQFGIALNVTAGLGAFAFGWIDDRIGPKRTVLIALVAMTVLAAPLLVVESKAMFWAFALPLGIFMGPAQAASRTLMAHMAPPEMRTEAFGLFALSGKVTSFLGPALVAWGTTLFASQRAGMATILILLVVGTALLATVRIPTHGRDAA